jgi:hypothetical protein
MPKHFRPNPFRRNRHRFGPRPPPRRLQPPHPLAIPPGHLASNRHRRTNPARAGKRTNQRNPSPQNLDPPKRPALPVVHPGTGRNPSPKTKSPNIQPIPINPALSKKRFSKDPPIRPSQHQQRTNRQPNPRTKTPNRQSRAGRPNHPNLARNLMNPLSRTHSCVPRRHSWRRLLQLMAHDRGGTTRHTPRSRCHVGPIANRRAIVNRALSTTQLR